jgi:hypothetical protein
VPSEWRGLNNFFINYFRICQVAREGGGGGGA